MVTDVKSRAISSLTDREGATDRDRDAARLLEECELDLRAVEVTGRFGGAKGHPAADVLIHTEHELASEAQASGAADRIERAIRAVLAPTKLRHLQWVESGPEGGPSTGAGAGEPTGKDEHVHRPSTNQPPLPKFERHNQDSSAPTPQSSGTHPPPPPPPDRRVRGRRW